MIVGVARTFHDRWKFDIEINGIVSASFQSITEPRAQLAVVEHHEGGSAIPNKSVGKATFPNLTLRRGQTGDLDLFVWFQQAIVAGVALVEPEYKRTFDVVARSRTGLERQRWTIFNAFVTEYTPSAGGWDNNVDEKTMEEVILAYDFFELGGDST